MANFRSVKHFCLASGICLSVERWVLQPSGLIVTSIKPFTGLSYGRTYEMKSSFVMMAVTWEFPDTPFLTESSFIT